MVHKWLKLGILGAATFSVGFLAGLAVNVTDALDECLYDVCGEPDGGCQPCAEEFDDAAETEALERDYQGA